MANEKRESTAPDAPTGQPASGGTAPGGMPGGERSPLDELEGGAFGAMDPPALMMAKAWIRQNQLLAVGAAFVAGTLISVMTPN